MINWKLSVVFLNSEDALLLMCVSLSRDLMGHEDQRARPRARGGRSEGLMWGGGGELRRELSILTVGVTLSLLLPLSLPLVLPFFPLLIPSF